MQKRKLFIDYDNTIVNSTKAFCETYNELYQTEVGFIPADWTKSYEYNFVDVCPLLNLHHNAISEIFESYIFFEKVEFMDNKTANIIKELDSKFEIHICSIGTRDNIYKKHKWMNKHLPFLSRYIFIMSNGCIMDKSTINMQDSIFIDDHSDNLLSSNAEFKISFGKRTECNHAWNGVICETWDEIKKLID